MEIPSKIKIGGHYVNIVHQEMPMDRFGASDTVVGKIYVNSMACESQQGSTLLHEILEHINTCCDLSLAHGQISVLEEMLYQVLKDNKLHFDE